MFETIQKLCEANGISGREDQVRAIILSMIENIDGCECHVDKIGNIIAFKKGKKQPLQKIMLSAHMDEVGMIVSGVTSDGMLTMKTVGGINPKVILGRAVYVCEPNLYGVIGTKAIHMQNADERSTVVDVDKLYIDIGAKDKEDALAHVSLGDSVCFVSQYREFGDGFIKAKAIDDRAGCAILLEVLASDLEYDTWFLFCTQEEVGLRGSRVGAYTIEPDIAIILESTASGDVSGVEGDKRVCILGDGPVISYMDNATIYDRGLYDLSFAVAKEQGISCQTKTMIAGGNDSGAIHVSRGGVRTVAVSLPSRYIHSPSNVVKKSDAQGALDLVYGLLSRFGTLAK